MEFSGEYVDFLRVPYLIHQVDYGVYKNMSFSVLVNGKPISTFEARKGLRQGVPFPHSFLH